MLDREGFAYHRSDARSVQAELFEDAIWLSLGYVGAWHAEHPYRRYGVHQLWKSSHGVDQECSRAAYAYAVLHGDYE